MKLDNVPNFRTEDYPTQQEWISRLFVSLNPFIQSVNQVLTNRVDYTTNIKSVTKDYSLNVVSFQEFSFIWPFKDATPVDLRVVRATKGATQTPTILFAAWSYDATKYSITVSNMVELSGTTLGAMSGTYQYSIRVTV